MADYETVRRELGSFERRSTRKEKPEIIVLTKSDTRDAKEIEKVRKLFKKEGKQVIAGVGT